MRPYTPADETDVRRIFRETLFYGKPVQAGLSGIVRYEKLCLDWFLNQGAADVGVLEHDGQVHGYVFVCTDLRSYYRWAARAATWWSVGAAARLAARRFKGADAAFHRKRLVDGWLTMRHAPSSPMPALVHLNLDKVARRTHNGLDLTGYADKRCQQAGLPGWFGEINIPHGGRAETLTSIGLRTVHRQPNRTLSWLLGRPIERLTVVREIDHPLGRDTALEVPAAQRV